MSTDELTELKKRADIMGIKYGPNISVATLKAKIEEALTEDVPKVEEEDSKPVKIKESISKKTDERKEANKLVRCIITCLDPLKKSISGEIFTAYNESAGVVAKYIPFNVPYHVPQLILKQIRAAKCTVFTHKKDSKDEQEYRLTSAYGIEELPPLTQKELDELARSQARAGATLED